MHVHIGGLSDKPRVYNNIIHFLPALALYTANSPYADSEYYGQYFRMAHSWAIGPIQDNWEYRFQDLIHAKRLGTLEVRIFDPVWDLERVRHLLKALDAIVNLDVTLPPAVSDYNRIRPEMAEQGMTPEVTRLVDELSGICDVPRELLEHTASDAVKERCEQDGMVGTYTALDNAYRCGKLKPKLISNRAAACLLGVLGFTAYFVPRLPYYAWKGIVENH
jgi:gamma-glutamyl:cysteine ligase YbdK (ATP-grasp superfamily)